MLPPSTPTKAIKADIDINTRVQYLALKRGLQIPLRDTSWSPSRSSNKSSEQHIFVYVRWLYFTDEFALVYAVAKFENYAGKNWVAEPRADLAVRTTSSQYPSKHASGYISKDAGQSQRWQAAELRDQLLSVLKATTDN